MSAYYHAPSLKMEINKEIIPGYPYGLVFEFIDAGPLGTAAAVDVIIEQVLAAINRLHKDNVLEKLLTQGRKQRTYKEAFVDEYISRFEEDLEVIQAHRDVIRSFVSDETIIWFGSEIQLLKELVSQHPAFQSFAAGVVHNDLNWQNVLVEPQNNGQFWIIDWDNLSANGDAAMDYSVLLWPLYSTVEWTRWKKLLEELANEETLDRVELYFRAKLLDDVIDVLADYIDAEDIRDVKELTQERAKKIHLQSIALYKEKYG
jgi:aminoglycoside phosphotransferase (APT) family kinase protein